MTTQTEPIAARKTRTAKPRKGTVGQTLRKISEMTAQAAEAMRRDEHRARKEEDRLRILLIQYAGPVLEMLKRVEIPDDDRKFLQLKGYIRERKER